MVQLASVNAFIIWSSVQIAFTVFDRYVRSRIKTSIEEYHDEFVTLRYWSAENNSTDLATLKSLKAEIFK